MAPQQVYTGDDVGIAYPKDGSDLGTEQGASGESKGAVQISRGAMIAIIVVVVAVSVIGISMATLFYVAKKREWKIREGIRRSTKKVVAALTPRRTEFPRSVKDGSPNSKRRVKVEEVPPTPRLRPEDLEKGLEAAKKKQARWGR